jgi:hypothetical protein
MQAHLPKLLEALMPSRTLREGESGIGRLARGRAAREANEPHTREFREKSKGGAKMQGAANPYAIPSLGRVLWSTTCAAGRVPSDEPNYKALGEGYLASIKALRLHVARYYVRSLWLQQIETGKNFTPPTASSGDVKSKPPRR